MGYDWENKIDSRFVLSKAILNNGNIKRTFSVDFCEDWDIKGETHFEIKENEIYFYPL